jgi:DNA-binding MarR family transcriptional regulator
MMEGYMGAHTSGRPHETRGILDAVRRIVRELHESSRAAEKQVGLSGAQLFVLQTLGECPGASLNDLAARTHTHQSSVSTVVAKLVQRGLVLRAPAAADARRLELRLSAEGRRLVTRAPDAAQTRLIHAIERLPASRRRTLAHSMAALTAEMDLAGQAPVMFFDETARGARRRGTHG